MRETTRALSLAAGVGAAFLAASGPARAQPVLGQAFTVSTVASPLGPGQAGDLANVEIRRLGAFGWKPISIAADYKSDSREGTTVQVPNSRLWAIHILFACPSPPKGGCRTN